MPRLPGAGRLSRTATINSISGTLVVMLGAIIIAVVIVILIPVGFLMSTAIPAGLFGLLLKRKAEADYVDSELVNTNY